MWRTAVFAIFLSCVSRGLQAEERPVEILRLSQGQAESGEIDYAALPKIGGTHTVVNAASVNSASVNEPKIDLHNLRLQLHN